jgi:hypothetical protein
MSEIQRSVIIKNNIYKVIRPEEYVKKAYENPGEFFTNCEVVEIEPPEFQYPFLQRTPSYCSVSKKIYDRTIEINIAFYGGRLFASLNKDNIESLLNNIENEYEIVPYLIHILEDYKPTLSKFHSSNVVNSILNIRIF